MEKMDMAGLTQVTSSILISFFLCEFFFLYSCIGHLGHPASSILTISGTVPVCWFVL